MNATGGECKQASRRDMRGGKPPIRIKEEYKLQEDRIQGSTTKKERKNKQPNKKEIERQSSKRLRNKLQSSRTADRIAIIIRDCTGEGRRRASRWYVREKKNKNNNKMRESHRSQ
jgi:hypothetical protein